MLNTSNGYDIVKTADQKEKIRMSEYEMTQKGGKQRAVHILLMEQALGRPLKDNEVVHHINGVKDDNRLENLQVMDRGEHTKLHKTGITLSTDTLEKLREAHKGQSSKKRKLNREQTREIAERLKNQEHVGTLAKEFGVSSGVIMRIRDGTAYRDWLDDYPEDVFPLQKKRYTLSQEKIAAKQHFSKEELEKIRRRIQAGESDLSIAKAYGVSSSTIKSIRTGKTYTDIPWPKKKRGLLHPDNLQDMAFILLKYPMSRKKDEYKALKEDYHMIPSPLAMMMLRLVRKALVGDKDLAMMLLVLGGYENMVAQIFMEESTILNTFFSK
ncbi:MAG: HNH endonuclease [Oscillospiraceae bacterium]|nr:HNH endonuclease [Oscillospiraceae bacterium]